MQLVGVDEPRTVAALAAMAVKSTAVGAPVPLPRLRGTCATCAAVRAGLQRCTACGQVEYCDKAVRCCLRLHPFWSLR
jgi:hypothetical protein